MNIKGEWRKIISHERPHDTWHMTHTYSLFLKSTVRKLDSFFMISKKTFDNLWGCKSPCGPKTVHSVHSVQNVQCTVYCIHCVQFTVYSTGYTVHCTVQAGVHVEAPNIISKLKYKYKHGNLCIILNSTNVQSYVTHCTLYTVQ